MDLSRVVYSRELKVAAMRVLDAGRRAVARMPVSEIRQAATKGQAVNALCQMTGLSRAGFYRWRLPPQGISEEMEIRDEMQKIALEWPAYGYRRMTIELQQRGFQIQYKRENGITAGQPSSPRPFRLPNRRSGRIPCVALSSARVFPRVDSTTLANNAFPANSDYPLNFLSQIPAHCTY